MKRDMLVYIEDILECIEKIEEYTKEIDKDGFYKNTQVQDAVLRRLEITGERFLSGKEKILSEMKDRTIQGRLFE